MSVENGCRSIECRGEVGRGERGGRGRGARIIKKEAVGMFEGNGVGRRVPLIPTHKLQAELFANVIVDYAALSFYFLNQISPVCLPCPIFYSAPP
jgi:hypothetical protein